MARQIGALAKQYTTPNPEALMQAKQAGNISYPTWQWHGEPDHQELCEAGRLHDHDGQRTDPFAGERPGELVPERSQGRGHDCCQFAQLPDGTNHVATTNINGVSKQLGINEQNSNYQKLQ